MSVSSMGDISREVAKRCAAASLAIDCGPDGVFNAEIAIIAEAPGERERIMKLPLVGASGKFLWEQLRKIGLNRRQVYISNVVKRQLRNMDDEKVNISRNEVDQYAQILKWELEQLPNLRYVIVLGNYALEAVTGLSGIMQHRGSVYQSQVQSISQGTNKLVTVLAMLNPAAVIREPKWEIMFRFDISRLDRVLKGEYKEHTITSHINPSPTEAIRWIEKMQDEHVPVALDIETIGQETACIGLANSSHEGMCINFRNRSENLFSVQDEVKVRMRLQQWFDSGSAKLVMQNGMFDSYALALKDRLILPASHFDTMLAHHTLYPSLPHNLGFLTSQYTEHPFYKDDGKEWREGGDIDTFWRYNVTDCCITYAVYLRELQELREQKLDKFFFDHVMRLQPHLVKMTVGGVLVDTTLKQSIAEELSKQVAILKEEFYRHVAETTGDAEYRPNPASPKQMSELFFRKLRLVGRGVATDAKNRARMRAHPKTSDTAKALLNSLDQWAKEQKFLSTYVESEIDVDNRARCEYKQTGVQSAPGRLSSSQLIWGTGFNLQNQPQRAQKMFIADPGYGFSYFDLTQAEAQVVGKKAKIQKWNEQYAQARLDGKYDAHRALASEMFNTPYDDVPVKDWEADGVTPTIRYIAKRCRHGLNYRMGADRLAEVTGLPIRDAENAYRLYHRINPELQRWWDATTEEVRRNRCLYNAYGRRWILLERIDDETLKSIVAFYPQSTIGDKVSRCIYLCHDDPDWPTGYARMALNIHDALIAIHSLDKEVTAAVQHCMIKHAEEPLYIDGEELIISAELKASVPDEYGVHRWSTLEKVKH
jgi:uracil-DNA glycosylase family 4